MNRSATLSPDAYVASFLSPGQRHELGVPLYRVVLVGGGMDDAATA
ncbi:hypothetical protein [Rhodococcus pyridinivorans]